MARTFDSWKYRNVDSDRETRLRNPVDFSEIVTGISNGSICQNSLPRIETNEGQLCDLNSEAKWPPKSCRRIRFCVLVDRQLHDIFVNSQFGLFGKYYESVKSGRLSTAEIIKAIKANDSLGASILKCIQVPDDIDPQISTSDLWNLSLDPERAVVWFDEDEFPREKYKRNSINFNGPARPLIIAAGWRSRPVFSAGTRIVIKGAWVSPERTIAVLDSKRDNDLSIHENGFS